VASNASTLHVFVAEDQARRAFQLNLRGAEIHWVTPPPNALRVERAIHRQRASQQAARAAATMSQDRMNFGRDLRPADRSHGVLVGFSTDTNASRDPDNPHGSLKLVTTDELSIGEIGNLVGAWNGPFTITARGFLRVPQDGEYWFSVFSHQQTCLAIDKQIVLGCQPGANQGLAFLTTGLHRFDFRFVYRGEPQRLELTWLPPGAKTFTSFPQQSLLLPESGSER
jgi:hypothetical protein